MVRVIVEMTVLKLISAYAPQAGRQMVEGRLYQRCITISEIDDGEKLLICGDLIGLVGAEFDGFEGVLGGFGNKECISRDDIGICTLNIAI